nr:hypothetical protein [Tanacetum cinerariifolium]
MSYKDSKIVVLKSKLEKISKAKDDLKTKIKKFENVSQSLNKLIGSQITNNSKEGLGYVSYNVVPPPHTERFSPLKINLSHTGLPEFAELSVQSYRVKPIEVVTQKSSVKIYAPVKEIIEDWESEGVDKARCKYHQREKMVNETNHSRMYHSANIVPKLVLTRTGLKPVNSVRPVNLKRVESSETDLMQTKQIYGDDYTKLIKKVKKLEQTVKSSQANEMSKELLQKIYMHAERPRK